MTDTRNLIVALRISRDATQLLKDDMETHSSTKGVMTMIEWDADDWGGRVHFASDGSWVADKHGDENEQEQ